MMVDMAWDFILLPMLFAQTTGNTLMPVLTYTGHIMRRLYFLLPDRSMAKNVINELLLEPDDDHHIHVLANDITDLGNLPEASLLQKSDFITSAERGLGIGGITGILAGIAAVNFPAAGLALGGGTILISSLLGTIMGAWASSMIGVNVKNTQTQRSDARIEKGEILLMVDAPKSKTDAINAMVHHLHPKAQLARTEPQIPVFP
jgi:hypothetical protein